MSDLGRYVARYVAVWNEPDSTVRDRMIPELWSPEVSLYNRLREYHGHSGIEQATKRSYDLFVSRGFRFKQRGEATGHHGAIRFAWEMLTPDGEVDSIGMQFVVFGGVELIWLDYQFIEPAPAS